MGKKVMLVDDTETVLMFEKMMLSGHGFSIVTACNGEEALSKVGAEKPDMIFLDIVMPKLDGVETCRRLKENPKTKDIPVVMVTTKGEPERVEQAFRAGCNDYITKPVDKLELMAKVRTYLS